LAEREQDIQQLGQIITAVQRGDIQLEHLQQLDLSGGLYSDRDRAKPKSAADRAKDEQPAKFTAIPTEEVTWEVRSSRGCFISGRLLVCVCCGRLSRCCVGIHGVSRGVSLCQYLGACICEQSSSISCAGDGG